MDTCGADDGHLVIFDRAEDKPWQEKIFVREAIYNVPKEHIVLAFHPPALRQYSDFAPATSVRNA